MEDQENWVTLTEAAKQLGINQSTFQRWIRRLADSGQIRTRRDVLNQKIILVNLAEVEAALKNRYQGRKKEQ